MNEPRFTTQWHKHSARYIWEKKFLPLKTFPVNYGEVGCFQGRSTHWMLNEVLQHHEHSHCWTIDPWLGTRKIPQEEMDANYQLAQDNLKEFIDAGRCTIYRDLSQERLPRFPDNIFDILYLDGNHDYMPVVEDITLGWPKIRPGGLCIFDDHLYRRKSDQVAKAVRDLFLDDPERYNAQVYFWVGKQICMRKPVLPGETNASPIAEYTASTSDNATCGPDGRRGAKHPA